MTYILIVKVQIFFRSRVPCLRRHVKFQIGLTLPNAKSFQAQLVSVETVQLFNLNVQLNAQSVPFCTDTFT